MQMIRMLKDWLLAEDSATSHWLTAGNTFAIDDDAAERAVDGDGTDVHPGGFAEYVGARPSKKAVPAAIDGEPVVSAHAAGTAVDTAEAIPENVPDGTGANAPSSPATTAVAGEPAPNTVSTKATKGTTAKTGEDAPA